MTAISDKQLLRRKNLFPSKMSRNLSQIERIEREELRLSECHHLNEHIPRWIIAFFDGVEQISNRIVRVKAGQLGSPLRRQVLDLLIRLK